MPRSCRRTADGDRPAAAGRNRPALDSAFKPLFSPTSQAERQRTGRRLLWAVPVALLLLLVLVWLGPSVEEVDRKFTIYGTEGPLRLMPEIVIEDGRADQQQQAWRETTRPPAAPHYEVLPEDPDPRATEPVPPRREVQTPTVEVSDNRDEADEASLTDAGVGDAAVDMHMPSQQADSDFIIRKLVRPLYPVRASLEDRRRPVTEVEGAFFLDSQASIVAVMIQRNEGGPEFADTVREAMQQWEFEPRLRDGQPPAARWLVVTWRFRSAQPGLAN